MEITRYRFVALKNKQILIELYFDPETPLLHEGRELDRLSLRLGSSNARKLLVGLAQILEQIE